MKLLFLIIRIDKIGYFLNTSKAYKLISMIKNNWVKIVVLILVITVVNSEEWYEQGHQSPLNRQNFDSTIQKQGKFKFVKFFTRSCRYCRLLKQVEQQLREQKEWNFQFYSIDCSIYYDLCMSKASISAFPYVGIYNTHGQLHGTIGGYYPLQTMREAFNTIEAWQAAETQAQPQLKVTIQDFTQKAHESQTTAPKQQDSKIEDKVEEKYEKVELNQPKVQNRQVDEDDKGWSRSISQGIKMAVILAGVIIFNKTISPYLQHSSEEDDFSKPRIIQLPIHRQASQPAKENASETTNLLSDSL